MGTSATPTADAFRQRYRSLTEPELLSLCRRADLTAEALEALAAVIHERGMVFEADWVQVREHSLLEDHPFPKVYFARRLNADTFDGVLAFALLTLPMLLVSSNAASLPDAVRRLGIVGVPAAILYGLFRDAVGRGSSFGKRVLGLRLVDLRTGELCSASRVWLRNITDVVPILNLIDFILMCVDTRGQKLMDKHLRTQLVDRRDLQ